MTNPSSIEQTVMRRVTRIHLLRPIISAGALATVIFIIALWGIGREVWVARVLENMPHSPSAYAFSQFWLSAFTHTRSIVQVLSLFALASLVYAVQRFVRSLSALSYLPT